MTTKTFDCVEMKRRGSARIYKRIKDMSLEEKIEYWRRRSREFLAELERYESGDKCPGKP